MLKRKRYKAKLDDPVYTELGWEYRWRIYTLDGIFVRRYAVSAAHFWATTETDREGYPHLPGIAT